MTSHLWSPKKPWNKSISQGSLMLEGPPKSKDISPANHNSASYHPPNVYQEAHIIEVRCSLSGAMHDPFVRHMMVCWRYLLCGVSALQLVVATEPIYFLPSPRVCAVEILYMAWLFKGHLPLDKIYKHPITYLKTTMFPFQRIITSQLIHQYTDTSISILKLLMSAAHILLVVDETHPTPQLE